MKRKVLSICLSAVVLALVLTACGAPQSDNIPQDTLTEAVPESSEPSAKTVPATQEEAPMDTASQNAIGAMSPEDALAYMQKTENLVIVDVAATQWYEANHFKGAINIPIEELDSEAEDALYMEIPADRPVLMHCRQGAIVPGAYERVLELRPDIPEIAYIDGAPPFDAYNEWFANQ